MLDDSKFMKSVRIFFIFIIAASISDIIIDINQGTFILHIFQEVFMGGAALSFLTVLFSNTRLQAKRNEELKSELTEIMNRSAKISQDLVIAKRKFGEEMVKQFSDWSFTDSEAEVAMFTLKGLSAKEIANLRNASEKTVRNQLTSVYKKSGTTGKISFISSFMESLI